MRIHVTVKPRASKPSIKRVGEDTFIVAVSEPAHENRANHAVADSLADYFDVAPSRIRLVRGEKGKQKVFEILS